MRRAKTLSWLSLVIVWRFSGARLLSEHAERRALRLVAIQFFLLAPYIGRGEGCCAPPQTMNAVTESASPDCCSSDTP